jgi:hypothetical protein
VGEGARLGRPVNGGGAGRGTVSAGEISSRGRRGLGPCMVEGAR